MTSDSGDVASLRTALAEAVRLQAASALRFTLVAGALLGRSLQPVAERLARFGAAEADDTRLLVEKLAALGGEPEAGVPTVAARGDDDRRLRDLLEAEQRCVAALHAALPGLEPAGGGGDGAGTGSAQSAAVAHLLEHVVLRKQAQLDYLARVLTERAAPVTRPAGPSR